MNLRSTTFLFGLLMAMLWLFGVMLAGRQGAAVEGFLMPSMRGALDVTVDTIVYERKPQPEAGKDKKKGPAPKDEPAAFRFHRGPEGTWTLQVGDRSTRVEGFRVTQIVDRIKDARHNETADLRSDLAFYGLDAPWLTIALEGEVSRKPTPAPQDKEGKEKKKEEPPAGKGEKRTWKFFVGKQSADKAFWYVNTSDRPGKVFAVDAGTLRPLLFGDPDDLRPRLLFNFDVDAVQKLTMRQEKTEVAVRRTPEARWKFEKPDFGYIDYEGQPPPKDLPPGVKMPETGLKNLLTAIRGLRVEGDDDFVPLQAGPPADFGLADGKESLHIEILGKDAGKELKDILLLGNKVPGGSQVYARIGSDPGIVKLNLKQLEPILRTLADPGRLRSRDLSFVDMKTIVRLRLEVGKTALDLRRQDKNWNVQVDGGKETTANDRMVENLLESLKGKQAILDFDPPGKDADLGFDTPQAVVRLFTEGAEAMKEEKEAKKDDKAAGKNKNEPVETLVFGGSAAGKVNVRRTLNDGTVSRFTVNAELLEKVAPPQPALAFLDLSLPGFPGNEVERVEIVRPQGKIELQRGSGAEEGRWFVLDPREASGKAPADQGKLANFLARLSRLEAVKWLQRLAPKEDLKPFGLAAPEAVVRLRVRPETLSPASTASLLALAAFDPLPLAGYGSLLAHRAAAQPKEIVLELGKESAREGDPPGMFARRSDTDLLFLLPPDLVRGIREVDLRDRSAFLRTQPLLNVGLLAAVAGSPPSTTLLASPLVAGPAQAFDPAAADKVQFLLRTPFELRSFVFARKDKTWVDQSGLKEFRLDGDKVGHLLQTLSRLPLERVASLAGPEADMKLDDAEAILRIETTLAGGNTVVLSIGAPYPGIGRFARSSAWPGVVFLLAETQVEPWLRGPAWFAQERQAAAAGK